MESNSCVLFEMLVDCLRKQVISAGAENPDEDAAAPKRRRGARAAAQAAAAAQLKGVSIHVHWPSRHHNTTFCPPHGFSTVPYTTYSNGSNSSGSSRGGGGVQPTLQYTTAKYPVTESVTRLLKDSCVDVERLSRMLVFACSTTTWSKMVQSELRRFESLGWRLTTPLSLMRTGVRDLAALTTGIDENSSAVTEIILDRVCELETLTGAKAAGTATAV
jgi:hypothetical protein